MTANAGLMRSAAARIEHGKRSIAAVVRSEAGQLGDRWTVATNAEGAVAGAPHGRRQADERSPDGAGLAALRQLGDRRLVRGVRRCHQWSDDDEYDA